MSRKCDHDWFDHYMMYNMMSNGGGKGSGEAFWLLIAGGIGLYPSGPYMHSKERNWFKAHLDAQGIPYDNEILDEVCHINGDKAGIELMYSAGKRRRWF